MNPRTAFQINNPHPTHTLRCDMNYNKMERMNREIRDREKTMRGLKKKNTPILSGYQIYHNYLRPHGSLNGKTPSEACGIPDRRKKQVDYNNSERKQKINCQCVVQLKKSHVLE
jgi:hypothetical protein